ncbi:hypothetical protein COOONC_09311, partial [Cooperia oncophora]
MLEVNIKKNIDEYKKAMSEMDVKTYARFQVTSIELTGGITLQNMSYELFAKNIWSYIMNYYPDGPKPFVKMDVFMSLLTHTASIFEKEPTVLELSGEITVMGPIYGEGDSLITLLSLVGMPPQKSYVFLGCYFGLGF